MDILTEDTNWFDWSANQLTNCAERETLHINPIIYAEVAMGFQEITQVESVLSPSFFQRDTLPYEAAFLTGQAFLEYCCRSCVRRSPLSDFYIGAHDFLSGYILLSRDANHYQTYFPELVLITP